MSFIRRRTSNNSNIKNTGIRRRTNNTYYYQNFVPASSRFNNDNAITTNRTNRIRKQFADILNTELQKKQDTYYTYQVQNEENIIQGNDNDSIAKIA